MFSLIPFGFFLFFMLLFLNLVMDNRNSCKFFRDFSWWHCTSNPNDMIASWSILTHLYFVVHEFYSLRKSSNWVNTVILWLHFIVLSSFDYKPRSSFNVKMMNFMIPHHVMLMFLHVFRVSFMTSWQSQHQKTNKNKSLHVC